MKNRMPLEWGLALALATAPAFARGSQEAPAQLTNTLSAVAAQAQSNTVASAKAALLKAATDQGAELDLSNAAFQPISGEKPLPPSLKPTAPAAEVIRLAEAGVEEDVMLAFITNSESSFNLGAADIIYLNDIGLPAAAITAMIERDQALKGIPTTNPATRATAPIPDTADQFAPAPLVTATTPPAPQEVAPPMPPQPDVSAEDYETAPTEDSAPPAFYDALAPYGAWVNLSGYGPCWQPTAVVGNPDWQPYLDCGRWIYTDCGWYWRSGYSWGWAPFHYGRWFRHSRLGWCWAPGATWGPSWVCWRYSGAYCGWAPLPPGAHYRASIGMTYWGRPVGNTFGFGLGSRSFAFVGFGHIWDQHLHQHTVPHQQAGQVFNQTVASASIATSNHRVINNGLPPSQFVAATHHAIQQIPVRQASAPTARKSDPTPSVAGALMLHGPAQPAPRAFGDRASPEITPRNSLVVSGRRDVTPTQSSALSPPANTRTPRIQNGIPTSAAANRVVINQRPLTTTAVVSETHRTVQAAWQNPAPAANDRRYPDWNRQVAQVPQPAPATAQPHAYTAPTTSYAPRAQAPAAPATAGWARPSLTKNGR